MAACTLLKEPQGLVVAVVLVIASVAPGAVDRCLYQSVSSWDRPCCPDMGGVYFDADVPDRCVQMAMIFPVAGGTWKNGGPVVHVTDHPLDARFRVRAGRWATGTGLAYLPPDTENSWVTNMPSYDTEGQRARRWVWPLFLEVWFREWQSECWQGWCDNLVYECPPENPECDPCAACVGGLCDAACVGECSACPTDWYCPRRVPGGGWRYVSIPMGTAILGLNWGKKWGIDWNVDSRVSPLSIFCVTDDWPSYLSDRCNCGGFSTLLNVVGDGVETGTPPAADVSVASFCPRMEWIDGEREWAGVDYRMVRYQYWPWQEYTGLGFPWCAGGYDHFFEETPPVWDDSLYDSHLGLAGGTCGGNAWSIPSWIETTVFGFDADLTDCYYISGHPGICHPSGFTYTPRGSYTFGACNTEGAEWGMWWHCGTGLNSRADAWGVLTAGGVSVTSDCPTPAGRLISDQGTVLTWGAGVIGDGSSWWAVPQSGWTWPDDLETNVDDPDLAPIELVTEVPNRMDWGDPTAFEFKSPTDEQSREAFNADQMPEEVQRQRDLFNPLGIGDFTDLDAVVGDDGGGGEPTGLLGGLASSSHVDTAIEATDSCEEQNERYLCKEWAMWGLAGWLKGNRVIGNCCDPGSWGDWKKSGEIQGVRDQPIACFRFCFRPAPGTGLDTFRVWLRRAWVCFFVFLWLRAGLWMLRT